MAEAVTDVNDYDLHRQLAIVDGVNPSITRFLTPFSLPHGWIINRLPQVDPITHESKWISTKFTLPEDWFVETVPRKSGYTIDKYYHDPETGRKFRSLKDVERYLTEGSIPTRSKCKRPIYHEKMQEFEEDRDNEYQVINMTPGSFLSTSPFLPEGWIVKEVPRKTGDHIDKMTPESKWITTKFTVPEDWFVKKVPRKSGNTIDKYYYDPETGRQFRSLKDVERYLIEGITPTTSKPKRPKDKEKIQNFEEDRDNEYQLVNVNPRSFLSSSPFILPDGWTVKKVARKTGDRIDKYYYEPGTGQMFRSKPSVQKHLAQHGDNWPLSIVLEDLKQDNLPVSKTFKLATPIKNYGSYDSWKKNSSKKEKDSSVSNGPPNKINWVMPSGAGETWNAFVGDEMVPDCMKQQWGKRFMLTINNATCNEQE